jgi:hypothetical protein
MFSNIATGPWGQSVQAAIGEALGIAKSDSFDNSGDRGHRVLGLDQAGARQMHKAAKRLLVVSLAAVLGFAASRVWADDWDKGKIAYRSKCGRCHGNDATGWGPMAPRLEAVPPDLTLLAKKNGGVFPKDFVLKTIDGRQNVEAHGPRDMPVWGYSGEAGEKTRLDILVDYLKRIQKK